MYCWFGNIWSSCFRNKSNFWKKVFLGEVIGERNNWPLRDQYMATWHDGTFDVNMTSLEILHRRHHIRKFLRRSLVLKIQPNKVQTLGTTDKREKRKYMVKSEGRDLLTFETLKTLYYFIKSPWFRMNPTHFFTELRKLQQLIHLSLKLDIFGIVEEVKVFLYFIPSTISKISSLRLRWISCCDFLLL